MTVMNLLDNQTGNKGGYPPFILESAKKLNIDEYISLHTGTKKKISDNSKIGNIVTNKAFLTIPRISNGKNFPICYNVYENFNRVYSYKENSISMDISLYQGLTELGISHVCFYIRNPRFHLFIPISKFTYTSELNRKIGIKQRCRFEKSKMRLEKNWSIKINKMIKKLSVNIKEVK